MQTLSLIYHLFSFPRTHFPLIAFKPTDEKDSFCLLPLVFDRLYKRLLLILCKDITLIMRFLFFLFFFIADGACPSVSHWLDPPTFPTLCKDNILLMRLFCKFLAIGLPTRRDGVRKHGSRPSVSDQLDPPTFPTLCNDITLVMRLFFKSLAIGLPASRVGVRKDRSCPSVSDRLTHLPQTSSWSESQGKSLWNHCSLLNNVLGFGC